MTMVLWSGSSEKNYLKSWKDSGVFYTVVYLVKHLLLVPWEADHLPNETAALEEVTKQNTGRVHWLLAAFGKVFKKEMSSKKDYPVFKKWRNRGSDISDLQY